MQRVVCSAQARTADDSKPEKTEEPLASDVHGGTKRKRSVAEFFMTRQQRDRCKEALADFIFGHAGSVPLSMVEAALFKRFLEV